MGEYCEQCEKLEEERDTERFLKLEAYATMSAQGLDRMPTRADFAWLVERIRVQDTLLDVYRCKQRASKDAVPVPPVPEQDASYLPVTLDAQCPNCERQGFPLWVGYLPGKGYESECGGPCAHCGHTLRAGAVPE